jgi:hypothetical protein
MSERQPKPGKFVDPEKAFIVHPDMVDFFTSYGERGMTFEDVKKMRDWLTSNNEPYWNTDHDAEMLETAEERTRIAAAQGWKFHYKK